MDSLVCWEEFAGKRWSNLAVTEAVLLLVPIISVTG